MPAKHPNDKPGCGPAETAASPSGFRRWLARYRKLLLLGGAALVPGFAAGPFVLKKSGARPRLAQVALAHVNLSLVGPRSGTLLRADSLHIADSLRTADSLRMSDSLRIADSLQSVLLLVKPDSAAAPFRRRSKEIGSGKASYYGNELAGRRTANGERFDPAELTAAHPTLPFGSLVRVTHAKNGKSVVVRINDRGPFTRSRIIDLSKAAAHEIEMVRSGTATVTLELIEEEDAPQDPPLLADTVQAPGR